MKKQVFIPKNYLIFFMVISIVIGCNDDKKNDTAPAADVSVPGSAAIGSGYLDTLIISAKYFKDSLTKNKAMFAFYAGGGDTLTLHGWEDKGGSNQYSTTPNVKLTKYKPSTISYGPDTYFVNVNLDKVNKINSDISTHGATFVIFAPQKTGAYIGYKIFLSNGATPTTIGALAIIPTGEEANPSPPKNSN